MTQRSADRKFRQLAVVASCWVSVAASAGAMDVAALATLPGEPAQQQPAAGLEGTDTGAAASGATLLQTLAEAPAQVGKVTFYARRHKGHRTASGERYDPAALTMAHRTLPIGSRVRVTNLRNHRSVVVRVNDRGPFVRGRIADLSLAAARQLRMVGSGVVTAAIEPMLQGAP